MTTVAIIIPTVTGREADLERARKAYKQTGGDTFAHRFHVVRDFEACGPAWVAGAEAETTSDYIHFTADDLEPQPGWLDVAVETVREGFVPAPLVFNPDGSLDSAGLEFFGQYRGRFDDWQIVDGTTVPFLTREMWERIKQVEGFVDLLRDTHYTTDLAVSAAALDCGWPTVIRPGMRFTHYTAAPGRDYGRAGPDIQKYVDWRQRVCGAAV